MVFLKEFGFEPIFERASLKVKSLILVMFKGCCGYNGGFSEMVFMIEVKALF